MDTDVLTRMLFRLSGIRAFHAFDRGERISERYGELHFFFWSFFHFLYKFCPFRRSDVNVSSILPGEARGFLEPEGDARGKRRGS